MAPDRRGTAGFVCLWMILAFLWFAANSSFAPESIATGVVISAALAYMFARRSEAWSSVSISPGRLYHFFAYTGVFAVELVRANLNMGATSISRRIDIHPGIVKIRPG